MALIAAEDQGRNYGRLKHQGIILPAHSTPTDIQGYVKPELTTDRKAAREHIMPVMTLDFIVIAILATSYAGYLFIQRRRAEEALRQNVEVLDEIQHAARIGYWQIDVPTGRITWSDEMYHLLGIAPRQGKLTLALWMSGYHPRDRYTFEGSIMLAQEEGQPFDLDARILNKDGFSIWTRIAAKVKQDANGLTKTVYGTAMDISNRKSAEELAQDYTVVYEARLMELAQATEDVAALSIQDPLTRMNNSRVYAQRLHEEVNRVKRYHTPLSVLLMDIDNFKQINEAQGRSGGDEILRQAANLVQYQARETDLAARLKDDTFGIVLPHTSLAGAIVAAERIRRSVETAHWSQGRVTVSIGVAEYLPGQSYEDLTEIVQKTVHLAIIEGGNRVMHIDHPVVLAALESSGDHEKEA